MNIEAPFFTIIVPCCDVEPYVRECLDSVVNQPFTDWECILGVEESKDNTEEIAHEYVSRDSRFKMFTGPRSGSCSASRNTGIDMATGEYIIFLDGDDTIVEGSLQRLHDKIAERPGADIYPCAMPVIDEVLGSELPLRDNYPADFSGELTGPEATLKIYRLHREPCPMLQLSVFRREHLAANGLKCLHGMKRQDSEFAPRIRPGSVSTLAKRADYFLKDYAAILKSLLAFHAKVSVDPGFDRRISSYWARHWLTWLFYYWFSTRAIRNAARAERVETLRCMFADGFGDFDALVRAATFPRRVACRFVKLAARHPGLTGLADAFFCCVYHPLVGMRDALRG